MRSFYTTLTLTGLFGIDASALSEWSNTPWAKPSSGISAQFRHPSCEEIWPSTGCFPNCSSGEILTASSGKIRRGKLRVAKVPKAVAALVAMGLALSLSSCFRQSEPVVTPQLFDLDEAQINLEQAATEN